jgi:hypothetical protein
MAGFKGIIFAVTLTVLFAILLITTVVYEGNLYGKNVTEVSSGSLDLNKYSSAINSINSSSKSFYDAFKGQNSFIALTEVVVFGVFNIFISMANIVVTPIYLITDLLINVLQIPAIVVGVIFSLFIIGIIFAIYEAIKTGRND